MYEDTIERKTNKNVFGGQVTVSICHGLCGHGPFHTLHLSKKGNAPSWLGIVRVKMKRICAVNRRKGSQRPSWDGSGHVLLTMCRMWRHTK